MLCLTRGTVAKFGIQRLFSAQLVSDFPTVAAGFISDIEMLIGLMHPIRGPLLPFADSLRLLPRPLMRSH